MGHTSTGRMNLSALYPAPGDEQSPGKAPTAPTKPRKPQVPAGDMGHGAEVSGGWCRALKGGSSAGEGAWQRSPPWGGSRRAAPAPTGCWHSLISAAPPAPGGLRSTGCSANQGRLRAALITVTEYLRGQNRQVLESSSISSCRGWHSESRAHSGTSEDDEGRMGGAAPSPSLPGAA